MNLARAIVAFLLIPFSVYIHFILATKFEIYEHRPLWAIIVISAALIVIFRLFLKSKRFKKSLLLLNIISWLFVFCITWWAEILTSYETNIPQVSSFDKAMLSRQLVEMDGSEIEVSELIQETPFSLFLFYRGPW